MSINARQRIFISEYLKCKNATKAAAAAGYSKKSAHVCGPNLLEKPEIKHELAKALKRVADKAELKAADVLAEIRKLAFVNLKGAYDEGGNLLSLHEMPEDVQAALSSVESDEIFGRVGGKNVKVGHSRKIKITDKIRALELLAKHFKLLTEVQELRGKDGGPLVVLTMPANGSEAEIPQPVSLKSECNCTFDGPNHAEWECAHGNLFKGTW